MDTYEKDTLNLMSAKCMKGISVIYMNVKVMK